jgi:outer membrane murein-binding lipoprotein Lpp
MQARTSSTRSLSSGPAIRGKRGRALLAAVLQAVGVSLFLLAIAAALCVLQGCAAQRPPVPVIVSVCPPIPVPARPDAPRVVLPAPDAAGNYCLTQAQVNDLAQGIKDLQSYAAQLEAAVTVYNEAQTQAAEAERR